MIAFVFSMSMQKLVLKCNHTPNIYIMFLDLIFKCLNKYWEAKHTFFLIENKVKINSGNAPFPA